MRVLIVDDEAPMRSALISVLEHASIVGEGADSAEKAILRLAREPSIDVLLVDKNLPGKSGVDLVRWIRTTDSDLPVVMMTGYPSAESMRDTLNLGISAYVEKPFPDIFGVVDVLQEAVERRGQAPPPPSAAPDTAMGETTPAGVLIATASEDARPALETPFREAGFEVRCIAELAALLGELERTPPSYVVLDGRAFGTMLLAAAERVRRAAPTSACVIVSDAELELSFLRSLLQLGIRGLYGTASYRENIEELLGRKPPAPGRASGGES